MIKERIKKLQKQMTDSGIDVYFFNTSDYHMSEYVPEYFKTITYFSGFSGSLASMVVTRDDAYIFVDGRYHTQADRQCLVNGVKVMKLGMKDVEDPIAFISRHHRNDVIGLDGKRTSVSFVRQLLDQGIKVKTEDIYSDLIENRVPLNKDEIRRIDEQYVGLSRRRKIDVIRRCIKDKVHVVNNLESIAYLLNLRSNDIKYTQVFMSYLVMMDDDVYLFCYLERFV